MPSVNPLPPPLTRRALYTTRVQKAAGALPEIKTLLSYWDLDHDLKANLERLEQQNVLGKISRTRMHDLLYRTFKQRYLGDPKVLAALVTFAREGLPSEALDRILYFLTMRSDPLLRDFVLDVLAPRAGGYLRDVTVEQALQWVHQQIDAGKTESVWSGETSLRVARTMLAALRDFGVLEGANRKRIRTPYLPITAFAFVAFLLARDGKAGKRVLYDPSWQLFFLTEPLVEQFFLEAHQERLLTYHAAGTVIRLEFSTTSPQDYARALTQRSH